ncbi:hypothetical protein Tco_1205846 [Tanacetum coccineum]
MHVANLARAEPDKCSREANTSKDTLGQESQEELCRSWARVATAKEGRQGGDLANLVAKGGGRGAGKLLGDIRVRS